MIVVTSILVLWIVNGQNYNLTLETCKNYELKSRHNWVLEPNIKLRDIWIIVAIEICVMGHEFELWVLNYGLWAIQIGSKGMFGLAIFITHILVSITHYSKIVGLIAKRLFRKSITLFPSFNYLIFKLWKLKTYFGYFQFP